MTFWSIYFYIFFFHSSSLFFYFNAKIVSMTLSWLLNFMTHFVLNESYHKRDITLFFAHTTRSCVHLNKCLTFIPFYLSDILMTWNVTKIKKKEKKKLREKTKKQKKNLLLLILYGFSIANCIFWMVKRVSVYPIKKES